MLALVAGGAAYFYLRDVQTRAYHDAALTTVYVVESAIPRGTPASTAVGDNLLKRSQIPEQFRPADAVTDLATLAGEVAATDLTAGEVVSNGLFVSPAAAYSTAAASIPKGDLAITVSVGDVQDVAGLVQPGDLVDLLVLVNGTSERFLYQNARVLAVGTSVAAPTSSGPAVASASTPTTVPPSGVVTFAVPPIAAERLAFLESGAAGKAGSLYLALVPPHSTPHRQPAVSAGNLIPATVTPS